MFSSIEVKIGTLAECMVIDMVCLPPGGRRGRERGCYSACTSRAQSGAEPAGSTERPATSVNIIILDDYQDAVRKLKCASVMEALNAKVFTNTVKVIGQLSVRLLDAEVLVPIR